jgi:hypothetical protein
MRRSFAVLSVLLLLMSSQYLSAGSQSREEGMKAIRSQLLIVGAVPYKLEASYNGRGFQFCNTAAVRVERFRLGCVELKDGRYKVRSERPWFEGSVEPAEGTNVSCRSWDSLHGFFPVELCKKGKLAVVRVELANGGKWKLGE